ncbi:hypothetical protein F5Y17DRAFT_379174 [Xylariaceae sp. FL0594]|nr:hypothetical protein F5Y17DRAFT_379174 [Xylariaceae sp. FL0594]
MHPIGSLVILLTLSAPVQGHKPQTATQDVKAKSVDDPWRSFFETSLQYVDVAAKDASSWMKQAGKDINGELSKAGSPILNRIGGIAENTLDGAAKWTEQANKDIQRDPLGTVANSAVAAAILGLVLNPGLISGSVLNLLRTSGEGGSGVKEETGWEKNTQCGYPMRKVCVRVRV